MMRSGLMMGLAGTLGALMIAASASFAPAVAQEQAPPSAVSEMNNSASAPKHSPAGIAPDVTKRANNAAAMQNLPKALGGDAPNPAEVASAPPPKKTFGQKVKAAFSKINPERLIRDREYKKAAATFPQFCKQWEQKLRDREQNNLNHVAWRIDNGFETALYTGYSTVESCETHQSSQGFAIGKLGYEEYHYLIKAKTIDEAKNTKATPVDDTHTTEIFRWEKGKWFY